MAGIPGAGKTEFVQFIKRKDIVLIEHDQLLSYLPQYQPKHYCQFGNILVTKLLNTCFKKQLSFILDGTLSNKESIKHIKRALNKDYLVIVVYILQSKDKAWDFTVKREVETGRPIEKGGFKATCQKIKPNLLDIFQTYKDNSKFLFILVDKPSNRRLTTINDAELIEGMLKKSY